jgi:hypothetical protein
LAGGADSSYRPGQFSTADDNRSRRPDFNPIEQLFAKLKALLRNACERTLEALWSRIADLLKAFTSSECTNYFRNAGYTPQ